jgi:hypothetical protein
MKIVLRLIAAWVHFAFVAVASNDRRVAVVFRGETFRENSTQMSRTTGIGGFHDQKKATLSHLEHLLLPLVFEMNYSRVDVYLETRQTAFFTHLLQWYGPYIRLSSHALSEYGAEASPYARVQKILEGDEYAAVLLMRPDLILSPLFACSLAIANRSKILFSFREWKNGDTITTGSGIAYDRVDAMNLWLPRQHFRRMWSSTNASSVAQSFDDILFRRVWLQHDAMFYLVPVFGADAMGYIFPYGQYDADPQKMPNPLYTLAGRPTKSNRLGFENDQLSALAFNHTCETLSTQQMAPSNLRREVDITRHKKMWVPNIIYDEREHKHI